MTRPAAARGDSGGAAPGGGVGDASAHATRACKVDAVDACKAGVHARPWTLAEPRQGSRARVRDAAAGEARRGAGTAAGLSAGAGRGTLSTGRRRREDGEERTLGPSRLYRGPLWREDGGAAAAAA